jgi:hypothetical protein
MLRFRSRRCPVWRFEYVGPGFERAPPSEMARQVHGGDAVEARHLHINNVNAYHSRLKQMAQPRREPALPAKARHERGCRRGCEAGDRPAAVADQMIGRRDDSGQRRPDGGTGDLRQDRIEGRALPVASDEDGNAVLISSRVPGLAASPARRARKVGPSALDRFENEGFIGFDDPAQGSRLVDGRRAQKPMPSAERRRRMDAEQRRGLGQALVLDHRPGVIEPLLLLAQMRHRRFGQRVERTPATLAAISHKLVRTAPADDLATCAMRTLLNRDALDAAGSQRVLPTAAPGNLLRLIESLLDPTQSEPY